MNYLVNKKIMAILPFILFILLMVYLWKSLSLNPQELPSALLNKSVPTFTAYSLIKPQQIITQKIFLGEITLLHVWASWCNVCESEKPFLNELIKQYPIKLIGLNYKDTHQQALTKVKQENPYEEIIEDLTGKIGMDLGVYGTPETFLIDNTGIIRYRYAGKLTIQIWQKQFLPLIEALNLNPKMK
ncbi:MAG: Thiol:disulfide interchange protein DsbE [Legionellaceae bacterium]